MEQAVVRSPHLLSLAAEARPETACERGVKRCADPAAPSHDTRLGASRGIYVLALRTHDTTSPPPSTQPYLRCNVNLLFRARDPVWDSPRSTAILIRLHSERALLLSGKMEHFHHHFHLVRLQILSHTTRPTVTLGRTSLTVQRRIQPRRRRRTMKHRASSSPCSATSMAVP